MVIVHRKLKIVDSHDKPEIQNPTSGQGDETEISRKLSGLESCQNPETLNSMQSTGSNLMVTSGANGSQVSGGSTFMTASSTGTIKLGAKEIHLEE